MEGAMSHLSSEFETQGRVLSIQSHCVHSKVGNGAAVFPLQILGFDVDPIHSVQFSNHSGYPNGFRGLVLQGDDLLDLVKGLEENDILSSYSHLLTGFIRSESMLRKVVDLCKSLKRDSCELMFLCDPVLGDNGKLYVPQELISIYRDEIVPLASILTPNQFELELLSNMKVTDIPSAISAFSKLHSRGARTVILTSCDFGSNPNSLMLLASVSEGKPDSGKLRLESRPTLFKVEMPRFDCSFTGTGDLLAALLLAWISRTHDDFPTALHLACTTMNAVVSRTKASIDSGKNKHKELLIVQSLEDIYHPNVSRSPVSVTKI